MPSRVLEFSSTVAGIVDQVCRILLTENVQRLVKSALFDETVSSEVSTGGISSDEVLLREKALGSSVVAGGEMDLRQPECVLVVFL
jgi:hypothetical protein